MADPYNRRPLDTHEYAFAKRRLVLLEPGLSNTGGARSESRNRAKGGADKSRHLHTTAGEADDWVHDEQHLQYVQDRVMRNAFTLGMYGKWHDKGTGLHLHTQSVPVDWQEV